MKIDATIGTVGGAARGFSATLASGPDGELIGYVGGCARSAQLGESLEHHVLAIRLKR